MEKTLIKLPGCWKEAEIIQEAMNAGKDKGEDPLWSWDCNYKLDYDGPLLYVSSRFYPPVAHYGSTSWDGSVDIYFGSNKIASKKFNVVTLVDLKDQVERFVEEISREYSPDNLNYWKERCQLAEAYIEESPCDPDIYPSQIEAYHRWQNFIKKDHNKSLYELYSILHTSIKSRPFIFEGICNNINRLYHTGVFTEAEHGRLMEHFKSQRPSPELHPEYYVETGNDFWFTRDARGRHTRQIFVSKLRYIAANEKI